MRRHIVPDGLKFILVVVRHLTQENPVVARVRHVKQLFVRSSTAATANGWLILVETANLTSDGVKL